MKLTEEEKATLEMLGMTPEQAQKMFDQQNEAGQPVNWAGQTIDDFYISMLPTDSGYDFAKGVGHGSVRPVTVTEEGQEMAQTVAEIMAGFTPAGTAIDIKDVYQALENDDMAGLAMAGFGFVPGFGDTAKALIKFKRSSPEGVTVAKNLVEETTNAGKKFDKPIKGTIRGADNIKSSLDEIMLDGKIYHVHSTPNDALPELLLHGVGLRQNRAFKGTPEEAIQLGRFRATTHNNETSGTVESLRSSAFKGDSFLPVPHKSTLIYEAPEGGAIQNMVKNFSGTQRSSKHGEFIAAIDNQYLIGYIDRTGPEPVLVRFK